jgi:hypothetical protein
LGAVAYQNNIDAEEDEVLDQSQTSLQCVVHNTFLAQSFRPEISTLKKVELALYTRVKIEPIDITLSIRKYLYGRDIAQSTISSDAIPYNVTNNFYWDWIGFDFDNVDLEPKRKYYLVLSPSEGIHDPFEDNVMWFIGWNNPYNNGDSYAAKQMIWAPMWLLTTNIGDFSFKTYGF